MSLNLRLPGLDLWQTPTRVTKAALAGQTKEVYFAWLDDLVAEAQPKMHPRCTNAQRKALQSTPQWRDYTDLRLRVEQHKREVEAFLLANPDKRWEAL